MGCGALGSLIAGYCQRANIPLNAFLPPSCAGQTCYQGQLKLLSGETIQLSLAKQTLPAEVILVCLKAYQIAPQIAALSKLGLIKKNAQIILLNNGLGIREQVLSILPDADIVNANSTMGALKTAVGKVQQTGLGQCTFGRLAPHTSTSTPQILQSLIQSHPHAFSWSQQIALSLYQKLFINCLINPITARDQVKNGDLLQAKYYDELLQLSAEIASLTRKSPTLAKYGFNQKSVLDQVLQVAGATAANYSSMNRDIYFKRKTEIEYITGYLLTMAQSVGIELPTHQALYHLILQAETT